MTEKEIIDLIKANSFICDYRDGSQTFELGSGDLELIAKAILKQTKK